MRYKIPPEALFAAIVEYWVSLCKILELVQTSLSSVVWNERMQSSRDLSIAGAQDTQHQVGTLTGPFPVVNMKTGLTNDAIEVG